MNVGEILELCMYECERSSRTVYVRMRDILELCMYECERFSRTAYV